MAALPIQNNIYRFNERAELALVNDLPLDDLLVKTSTEVALVQIRASLQHLPQAASDLSSEFWNAPKLYSGIYTVAIISLGAAVYIESLVVFAIAVALIGGTSSFLYSIGDSRQRYARAQINRHLGQLINHYLITCADDWKLQQQNQQDPSPSFQEKVSNLMNLFFKKDDDDSYSLDFASTLQPGIESAFSETLHILYQYSHLLDSPSRDTNIDEHIKIHSLVKSTDAEREAIEADTLAFHLTYFSGISFLALIITLLNTEN